MTPLGIGINVSCTHGELVDDIAMTSNITKYIDIKFNLMSMYFVFKEWCKAHFRFLQLSVAHAMCTCYCVQ